MSTAHNGDAVVHAAFPYDGPHNADTITEAASAVAELHRYLNNATRSSTLTASELASTLQSLSRAASGYRQLLDQLRQQVGRLEQHGAIYSDQHPDDPQEAAKLRDLARETLDRTRADADALRHGLDTASGYLSRLGHRPPTA
ncbi:hypothetical protein LWC35_23985 [Pseudonocardia kujensis]|uniref:hypothetical protein n=1 Tax=Pseudonocardia kujensis TaxID=1128675 RepID=UPI001E283F12|nr:hypothetical protein [Pseudonocardia kujensis]MCE0765943.1 hypothetical protein [Pseudonocardia kujensis]